MFEDGNREQVECIVYGVYSRTFFTPTSYSRISIILEVEDGVRWVEFVHLGGGVNVVVDLGFDIWRGKNRILRYVTSQKPH